MSTLEEEEALRLRQFLTDVPSHLYRAELHPAFAFGASTLGRGCVVHTDEGVVAYNVGQRVAVHSYLELNRAKMNFLPVEDGRTVNFMSVTPSRKFLVTCESTAKASNTQRHDVPSEDPSTALAIASSSNKDGKDGRGADGKDLLQVNNDEVHAMAIIAIYSTYGAAEGGFKLLRTIQSDAVPGSEFLECAMGSDESKMVVTRSNGEEAALAVWRWDQGVLITQTEMNAEVNRLSVNPVDDSQLCTSGRKYLRFWKIMDGELRGFNAVLSSEFQHQDYTDHAWVDKDIVVAATSASDIFVFDQGELRSVMHGIHPDTKPLRVVVPTGKGFFVAGDGGFSGFYQRSVERDEYMPTKLMYAGTRQVPVAASMSPESSALVCAFQNGQVGYLDMSELDSYRDIASNYKMLCGGFHFGSITGMDVAVRKPHLVTCGLDRSVRLWNYRERTCDIVRRFHEEPLSVAVHPIGLDIVVGFANRLCLLNVLRNDFNVIHEYPVKSARICRFSHSGQFIAAASGSSIHVYSVFTYEHLATLKGHNGEVKSIAWSNTDGYLVSAGIDGSVYEWNMASMTRDDTRDHVIKTCTYSAVTYDTTGKMVVASGSDRTLRVLVGGQVAQEVPMATSRYTRLCFSGTGNLLFAGTADGDLLGYTWPLHGNADHANIPSVTAHSASVSHVALTVDDRFLFTAGEDGAIFVFELTQLTDGAPDPPPAMLDKYIDTFLITRSEFDEKGAAVSDLESKLTALKADIDFKLLMKDQHHADVLARKDADAEVERERNQAQYMALRKQKEVQEMETGERFSQLESMHSRAAEELEALYETKFSAQRERMEAMEREGADMRCKFEEEFAVVKSSYDTLITELKRSAEKEIATLKAALAEASSEVNKKERTGEDILRETMREYEDEIDKIKHTASHALFEEQERVANIKGATLLVTKKFDGMKREMAEMSVVVRTKQREIEKLEKTVEHQQDSIHMLQRELRETKDAVASKEARIAELKSNLAELEKFKFVLDYKINELKREIEPRDIQITEMREQIREMDTEIEKDHRSNATLELVIADKSHKLASVANELQRARHQIADKERVISSFCRDLFVLFNAGDDIDAKAGLSKLYHRYVTDDEKKKNATAAALATSEGAKLREFARQRDFMESNVADMQQRFKQTAERSKLQYNHKISENATLVEEISTLRRSNVELNKRVARLQVALQNAVHPAPGGSGAGSRRPGSSMSNASSSRGSSAQGSRPSSSTMMSRTPTPGGSAKSQHHHQHRPLSSSSNGSSASSLAATAPGGRLHRGTTRGAMLAAQERAKMVEMAAIIEDRDTKIRGQSEEIARLQDQVSFLLEASAPGQLAEGVVRERHIHDDLQQHHQQRQVRHQPGKKSSSIMRPVEPSKTPPPYVRTVPQKTQQKGDRKVTKKRIKSKKGKSGAAAGTGASLSSSSQAPRPSTANGSLGGNFTQHEAGDNAGVTVGFAGDHHIDDDGDDNNYIIDDNDLNGNDNGGMNTTLPPRPGSSAGLFPAL